MFGNAFRERRYILSIFVIIATTDATAQNAVLNPVFLFRGMDSLI